MKEKEKKIQKLTRENEELKKIILQRPSISSDKYRRIYYLKNKEKINKYNNKYREEHHDYFKDYREKYKKTCIVRI